MATKQEEIRQGIVQIIDDWHGVVSSTRIAEFITQRLDSQGVVIKVERDLPKIKSGFMNAIIQETVQKLKDAGYVPVMSLIGEIK